MPMYRATTACATICFHPIAGYASSPGCPGTITSGNWSSAGTRCSIADFDSRDWMSTIVGADRAVR